MTDNSGYSELSIGDIVTPESAGVVFDYEAEAAVTKGDPVYFSSDNKVSPAAAAQDCIGIAMKTVAAGARKPAIKQFIGLTRGGSVQSYFHRTLPPDFDNAIPKGVRSNRSE